MLMPFTRSAVAVVLASAVLLVASSGPDVRMSAREELPAAAPARSALDLMRARDPGRPATLGAEERVKLAKVRAAGPELRRPEAAPLELGSKADRRRRAEPVIAPDSLLVRYDASTTDAELRSSVEEAGGRLDARLPELRAAFVSVAPDRRESVSGRLADAEGIDGVEPNLQRVAAEDPNDAYWLSQGNAYTSRLSAAFDVTHGKPTTDIAILDTGVKRTHPDLQGRIGAARNFVTGDAAASDDHGHGTMVAGIAAADTNNGQGIAGAAYDARIMPVKVLDSAGVGFDDDIAAGIVWAAQNGAEIINLSLAGAGSTSLLRDAVAYAIDRNVIVVAAAGNEGLDTVSYPAAYPGVIAVGATDHMGDITWYSNRGAWVDVVAEGFQTVSTSISPGLYEVGGGTSFASPFVAGVAALVRARYPTLGPAAVEARLRRTAIDRGPRGVDNAYGWGLIDAYGAVGGKNAASPPPAARDAFEPDDVADDARPIGGGATGTISPEGDDDWFYVDTPDTSGRIVVTVTPASTDGGAGAASFDPVIETWETNLERTATVQADSTGPGQPESAHVPAATPGRYLFRVYNATTSRSSGVASAPDPYTVTTTFAPSPLTESVHERMWIRDMSPVPFSSNVAATVRPTAVFARDVTAASATSAASLRDATTNTSVTISRSYDAATRTLIVTPSQPLVAGHTYVFGVNQDRMYSTRFTVAAPPPAPDLRADFNRDGFEDVVIGVPGEDHGSRTDGGVVHVLYGSASGPRGSGSQMWSQDSPGIAGGVETGDRFGEAVATGDLNKDGYDDLVVGVPSEDLSVRDAGIVHVILGSASGLTAKGNTYWSQASSGIPGVAEAGDRFGAALGVGNFDRVAGHDVVVGAPGEDIGSVNSAGAVHVIRGAAAGLTSAGAQLFTEDSAGIDMLAEASDAFGAVIAVGDLEGDSTDDVAIGVPFEDLAVADAGVVVLMRGSLSGLRPAGVITDVDDPSAGAAFGMSVALGDVGGYARADAYDDLVVGTPMDDAVGATDAGRVLVLSSDHAGPFLAQQSLSMPGGDQTRATFGWAVDASAGAVAVGAMHADRNGVADAGAIAVFRTANAAGSNSYVGLGSGTVIDETNVSASDGQEAGDRFGTRLAFGDTDRNGRVDVVTCAPDESLGPRSAAGACFVLRDAGETSATYARVTQDTTGVPGAAESGDRFGASLS